MAAGAGETGPGLDTEDGLQDRAPTEELIDKTAMEAVAQLALSRPADDACMNISVLVVEDDFFQRGTLQQLFDRANRANEGSIYFEVRLLESTAEALSFLRSEGSARLDLVLLDVVFPGEEMSGRDLLRHVREAAGERTAAGRICGGGQMPRPKSRIIMTVRWRKPLERRRRRRSQLAVEAVEAWRRCRGNGGGGGVWRKRWRGRIRRVLPKGKNPRSDWPRAGSFPAARWHVPLVHPASR